MVLSIWKEERARSRSTYGRVVLVSKRTAEEDLVNSYVLSGTASNRSQAKRHIKE